MFPEHSCCHCQLSLLSLLLLSLVVWLLLLISHHHHHHHHYYYYHYYYHYHYYYYYYYHHYYYHYHYHYYYNCCCCNRKWPNINEYVSVDYDAVSDGVTVVSDLAWQIIQQFRLCMYSDWAINYGARITGFLANNSPLGPFLLTWFNFNPSMDK